MIGYSLCLQCKHHFYDGSAAVAACETCVGDPNYDGRMWCCADCAKADGLRRDEDGLETCDYCRGENMESDELIDRYCASIGKTRRELVALVVAQPRP